MKKIGVLTVAALICATYLSIALVVLGLDKFHYVLAGGRKFATLPDLNSQLGIGLSYLSLGLLYLIWFFRAQSGETLSRFTQVLKRTAVFLAIAFLAFPLGDDIYLYLHAGLMNLSRVNPFLTRAATFTSELSPFVDWGQTSTYGPVSQVLFTLSAAIVPISPILAIYLYKGFCLGLHVLNGFLIWRSLPSPQRDKIAIAYLLHPLLLMEQVGSGHVDVLVSTSAIVLIRSLIQERYKVSVAAIWAGFLAKTIPILWMPLLGVWLVRQQRWRQLAGGILLSLAIVAVLTLTVVPGPAAWHSLLNPGVAGKSQSSLHALVGAGLQMLRVFFPTAISLVQEQHLLLKLAQFTLVGFAAFYSWVALKGYSQRTYSRFNLIEDCGWVTLVLLLFATPWLMPWYASVLLAIAALIPQAQLFGLTSLMFALSSNAQYLLQGHNMLKSVVEIGLPIITLLIGARQLAARSLKATESSTTIAQS